jgi:hypothetical protein
LYAIAVLAGKHNQIGISKHSGVETHHITKKKNTAAGGWGTMLGVKCANSKPWGYGKLLKTQYSRTSIIRANDRLPLAG